MDLITFHVGGAFLRPRLHGLASRRHYSRCTVSAFICNEQAPTLRAGDGRRVRGLERPPTRSPQESVVSSARSPHRRLLRSHSTVAPIL
jgi:hypothetical protein